MRSHPHSHPSRTFAVDKTIFRPQNRMNAHHQQYCDSTSSSKVAKLTVTHAVFPNLQVFTSPISRHQIHHHSVARAPSLGGIVHNYLIGRRARFNVVLFVTEAVYIHVGTRAPPAALKTTSMSVAAAPPTRGPCRSITMRKRRSNALDGAERDVGEEKNSGSWMLPFPVENPQIPPIIY